jgi:DNA-binding transcriptional regulator YiaG
MEELQELRKLAVRILYILDQIEKKAPAPSQSPKEAQNGFASFVSSVNRALSKLNQSPFSDEELKELYDLSGKDPVLVGRLLFRSSRKGDELKPYVLATFRKYGAETVRSWLQERSAPPEPDQAIKEIVAAALATDEAEGSA